MWGLEEPDTLIKFSDLDGTFVWHVPEGVVATSEDEFMSMSEDQSYVFEMGDNSIREPIPNTTPYVFYWNGFQAMGVPPQPIWF